MSVTAASQVMRKCVQSHPLTVLHQPSQTSFLEADGGVNNNLCKGEREAHLDNTTFDAIFYNELDGLDRTMLTETVNTIHRLILDSGVPPAVHQVDARRFGEIEGYTTRLQADQEHRHFYIVHYKTVSDAA